MKLVYTDEELRNVDAAIPLAWADAMRDLGIDPFHYVWDYNEPYRMGKPVNLAEKLVAKFRAHSKFLQQAVESEEAVNAMNATIQLVDKALNLKP